MGVTAKFLEDRKKPDEHWVSRRVDDRSRLAEDVGCVDRKRLALRTSQGGRTSATSVDKFCHTHKGTRRSFACRREAGVEGNVPCGRKTLFQKWQTGPRRLGLSFVFEF